MSVVEKLWQLQLVMSALQEQERALEVKPDSFAETDGEYQEAKRTIETIQAKIDEAASDRRKLDSELQDEQEVLKKYQGQLMQVKNQLQYAAAWKEIDTSRKKVKEIEDKVLARMTEMEALQAELEGGREGFETLEEVHAAEYDAWQHALVDHRKELVVLRERAVGLEADLPSNLRGEFHRILRQRRGVAVSQVIDSSCKECRVRIRPQAEQQLRRGELVFCEGCRRIFYLESVSV